MFTSWTDFLDVLVRIPTTGRAKGGMGGRNDARKSNDILILTNKILIVGALSILHIITLFTGVTQHSYTANDSDFKPQ